MDGEHDWQNMSANSKPSLINMHPNDPILPPHKNLPDLIVTPMLSFQGHPESNLKTIYGRFEILSESGHLETTHIQVNCQSCSLSFSNSEESNSRPSNCIIQKKMYQHSHD